MSASIWNKNLILGVIFFASVCSTVCSAAGTETQEDPIRGKPPHPSATERLITLLGTNDIHGSAEPYTDSKTGSKSGGMAIWASISNAIRQGVRKRDGDHAGVLVLDAGDQFQGTLLSNYDEGQLIYRLMNLVGYDAAIPGNHAYDFGPIDWRRDLVQDTTEDFEDLPGSADSVPTGPPDMNPRGALEKLATIKNFDLLSANTYFKASLKDLQGHPAEVSAVGCHSKSQIDWTHAERPAFVQPYRIVETAGVRVALIGLDHPATSTTTREENIADLCFRDAADAYLETQASLKDRADIFVMIIHDGNTGNDFHLSRMIEKISAMPGRPIDAVIAGHTHFANLKFTPEGVPLIQSRSDGRYFGRIDLIWDTQTRSVVRSKTWAADALLLGYEECDPRAKDFCRPEKLADGTHAVAYEGIETVPSKEAQEMIAEARARLSKTAGLYLGEATDEIKKARDIENPLSNRFTDALRTMTGSDVAILNGGGLRANLAAGAVSYENLFRLMPFNNRAVRFDSVSTEQLVTLYQISAKSCGIHGSLFQSGLRIEYSRDCRRSKDGEDVLAEVEHIEMTDGTVLYDRARPDSAQPRTLTVATVDFLADGGSGYSPFKDLKRPENFRLGVLREHLRREFMKTPFRWDSSLDGRFKNRVQGGDPETLGPAKSSRDAAPRLDATSSCL